MQGIEMRPVTLEPDPSQAGDSNQLVIVEQAGIRGILYNKDQFRPLISGGCEVDDEGNLKDCESLICVTSRMFDRDTSDFVDEWKKNTLRPAIEQEKRREEEEKAKKI